jgi:hypothetical protein
MPALMDLLAGERREMLLALAVDDWDGLDDRLRFPAHLALGSGLDPTWLDLFSEAVRRLRGADEPVDFIDARLELPAGPTGDRFVEGVDRGWIAAVALVDEDAFDGLAGHWIDLLDEEVGAVGADEKPWIRELAGKLVRFARTAQDAPDVIFAWSI